MGTSVLSTTDFPDLSPAVGTRLVQRFHFQVRHKPGDVLSAECLGVDGFHPSRLHRTFTLRVIDTVFGVEPGVLNGPPLAGKEPDDAEND